MALEQVDRFPPHAGIVFIVGGGQHQPLNVAVVHLSGDYAAAGFIEHDLHFARLGSLMGGLHGTNKR